MGQELAQEAFFRVYERWARMAGLEHARRFTYRVAINLARSHVRRHVRVILAGLEPGDRRVDALATTEDWLVVRDALARLSGRQRAVVVLVDYVGMDAADAADVLRIGPATVRVHLMRARRALRTQLGLPEEAIE